MIIPTQGDELTYNELLNIVRHALINEGIRSVAAAKLLPEYLNRREESYLRMIWTVLYDCYNSGYVDVSQQMMIDNLGRMAGSSSYAHIAKDAAFLAGLTETVEYLYQQYVPPDIAYTLRMLQEFLVTRVQMPAYARLKSSDVSMEEIESKVHDLKSTTAVSTVIVESPFSFDDNGIPQGFTSTKRESYGLPLYDNMLEGYAKGECIGLLGLSGAGKTLAAVQIASSVAKSGKQVLYCSYEQGFDGDIATRFYSCTGDFDRNELKDKEPHEYSDYVKDRMVKAATMLKDHMFFMDMTKAENCSEGLADIAAAITKMEAEGRKPDVIIIDWLFPFMQNVVKGYKPENTRLAWQPLGNAIKDFAIHHNVHLILAHQFNTEMMRKPVTFKPTMQNAAELGMGFFYYMTGAIGFGRVDDATQVCLCTTLKSRSSMSKTKLIKRNGAFCRFEETNDYIVRNNKFVKKSGVSEPGVVTDINGNALKRMFKTPEAQDKEGEFNG